MAKIVNYFVYANDYSMSTNRNEYYHSNGLKTFEKFKFDVEKMTNELANSGEPITESKIIYLQWGINCVEVDEDTTRTIYIKKQGVDCGTCPGKIITWLQENTCGENSKIRLLYIITDGLILPAYVEQCFAQNENMFYENVVFHAFNESPNQVDLSVASSFFKKHCVVYCNNKLYDSVNIAEDFDYDKIDGQNFVFEKDNLMSYIKLKFLKRLQQDTRALQEIEKLKKLRARLFNELSNTQTVNLETKDRSVFLREFTRTDWYSKLVETDKSGIEKCIATLINYIISEKKSYSFDALKFNTTFKKSAEDEPIVDLNFTAEQEIAFPDIILEDEKGIPVVILTKLDLLDKIIFHGRRCETGQQQPASFNKFTSTMKCPLFLVNDKDISESIGYFYTLNVYKQFLTNNITTEPRTRKPFHGGLVLTDTDQFDKYNDYIILATYFDCKKVNYNVGLFYYVLWKNCENKEWMDRNVVDHFKKYVMRRVNETVCKIGLTSLPLDPQENTSLLTALWYCVEMSSCIFKDDPDNYTHERLRMFYGVAHYMIEILKFFDYDLDLNSIEKRRELLSYVMMLKKIQKREDKVYFLLQNIFKTVDGFLFSEIENPFNLYKLNYLKLNHKEMIRDDVIEETVHLNDYVHLMHFIGDLETSKAGKNTFEICEKTFRPYFAIDKNKSFYTDLVYRTRKVVISNDDDKDKIKVYFEPIDSLNFDRIVSLYNLFINCVVNLEKFPTLPEYLEYILKKKKFYNGLVTIFPFCMYFDIRDVYDRYQKLVTKVPITKFIEVCKTHVNRQERIKGEERVKFTNNAEIDEFIIREEMKVNLRKKTST